MNRTEHLLVILAEECAELAQAATKTLRFGLEGGIDGRTNESDLWREFNDLVGVIELIAQERDHSGVDRMAIQAKRGKVEAFLRKSAEAGTLKEDT